MACWEFWGHYTCFGLQLSVLSPYSLVPQLRSACTISPAVAQPRTSRALLSPALPPCDSLQLSRTIVAGPVGQVKRMRENSRSLTNTAPSHAMSSFASCYWRKAENLGGAGAEPLRPGEHEHPSDMCPVDERRSSAVHPSFAPEGLVLSGLLVPTVETVGYCRSSRGDVP